MRFQSILPMCKHEYERYAAFGRNGEIRLDPQGKILICQKCQENNWLKENKNEIQKMDY